MNTDIESKQERARKRIKEIKGFYVHLTVYVLVNLFISIFSIIMITSEGIPLKEALFNFGVTSTWFFWGIGLFFHGLKVFSINLFF